MLLKQETLRGIESGSISLAFRRWRRPTVKTGGSLLTPIGQLAIESVEVVDLEDITQTDAMAAGFPDVESLRSQLQRQPEGLVYRIGLSLAGPDPRIALRGAIPGGAEMAEIVERLGRLDRRATSGPWTRRTLELLLERPGERAADLAPNLDMERDAFKVNVRKLKGLGLTESLAVGYRLSPRGIAVLGQLQR